MKKIILKSISCLENSKINKFINLNKKNINNFEKIGISLKNFSIF